MSINKKITESRHISRKQFLQGLGTTLALPPLISMMPKAMADAVVANKKLRLCLLANEYGMHNDHLVPSSSASSNATQTINSIGSQTIPTIKATPLSSFGNPVSYIVDNKMNALKDDMNIIYGLDLMSAYGHNFGFYSGSMGGRDPECGRSIDVIISNSAKFKSDFKGKVPVVRNTNYAFAGGFFYDRKQSSSGNFLLGEANVLNQQRDVSDKAIFERLFGGGTVAPPLSADMTRRKLLIDLVKDDYTALRDSHRISGADKQLLLQFAESIFQVQKNLDKTSPSCTAQAPSSFASPTGAWPADWNGYWKNISEMMILAFQCDVSRIYCTSPYNGDQHHQVDDSAAAYWGSKWQKEWIDIMTQHLLLGLKNTTDPFGNGESLLDNSLVVWHNEHSGRAGHTHESIPVMTFGKLGGAVRAGYFMNFDQTTLNAAKRENRGYPSKMMMVTILEAMGVTRAEILREGDGTGFGSWPDYLVYANSTPSYYLRDQYDLNYFGTRHSNALPFFTNI